MNPRNVAPNARAAVFAAVCTLLAVAAHRLMSAHGIPLAAEVFGAAAVFCFARIAAGLGERGLPTIGLLVGGSQIGLHLLFDAVQASAAGAGPAAVVTPTSMPGMADMPDMTGMTSHPSLLGTTVGVPTGPTLAMAAHMSLGMTIAHVLAATLAAWWLRRGEAALFGVVERARVVVGASLRMLTWWVAGTCPLRTPPPGAPGLGPVVRQPVVARVLLFAVIRRGPPPAVCRYR